MNKRPVDKIAAGLSDAIDIAEAARAPTTDAARVAKIGRLLYGERWVSRLAPKLDVGLRFLERVWRADQDGVPYDIPPGFLADVRVLAEQHAQELQRLAAELPSKESVHG